MSVLAPAFIVIPQRISQLEPAGKRKTLPEPFGSCEGRVSIHSIMMNGRPGKADIAPATRLGSGTLPGPTERLRAVVRDLWSVVRGGCFSEKVLGLTRFDQV